MTIFLIPSPLVFLAFPRRTGLFAAPPTTVIVIACPLPLVASAIATIPAGGVVPRSVLVSVVVRPGLVALRTSPVLPLASHWHAEGAGAGLVEDPTLVTGKLEEEGALSASPLLNHIEDFATAQEAHHALALNSALAPDVHAGAPHAASGGRASGTEAVTASVPEALPPDLPPAVSGQPAVPAAPSPGFLVAHVPGAWRPLDREARRTSPPLSAPSLWHGEVLTCAARHASSNKTCQPKGFFRHVRSAFKPHGTLCG